MSTLADYIPLVGPLLADPDGRRWLLGVLVVVGLPARETRRDKEGQVVSVWRFRGALAALWEYAHGHRLLGEGLARAARRLDDIVLILKDRHGIPRAASDPPPAPVTQRGRLASIPDSPLDGG